VLICIGVVDIDVNALETGVIDRRRHVAFGKTPKRWWSHSIRRLSWLSQCGREVNAAPATNFRPGIYGSPGLKVLET
jgi:hypothetical protein